MDDAERPKFRRVTALKMAPLNPNKPHPCLQPESLNHRVSASRLCPAECVCVCERVSCLCVWNGAVSAEGNTIFVRVSSLATVFLFCVFPGRSAWSLDLFPVPATTVCVCLRVCVWKPHIRQTFYLMNPFSYPRHLNLSHTYTHLTARLTFNGSYRPPSVNQRS